MTLVEARGFLGWTQTRLAQEVGTSVSAINDIEHGRNKNPGFRQVMRIVKALQRGGLGGLSPEDVFQVERVDQKDVA